MIYKRNLRPDELMHFGVLGMHWGIRRYQNPDGSLTAKGKERIRKRQEKNFNELNESKGWYRPDHSHKRTSSHHIDYNVALNAYKNKSVVDSSKAVKNSFIAKKSKEYDMDLDRTFDKGQKYLEEKGMPYSDEAASAIGAVIFCAKKGVDAKKEYDSYWQKIDKYNDSCKAASKEVLGKYGNKKLKNFTDTKAKDLLNDTLKYAFGKELYGSGNLSNDLYEYFGYMNGTGAYGSDKDIYKWVEANKKKR